MTPCRFHQWSWSMLTDLWHCVHCPAIAPQWYQDFKRENRRYFERTSDVQ